MGHLSFSQTYNHWLFQRKEKVLKQVWQNRDLSGKKVLDIGCGTGFFTAWYLAQGALVTGIDITETSVQNLRASFSEVTFLQMDFSADVPDSLRPFDIVHVWDVFFHQVDDARFARFLNNIGSVSVSGTMLLATDILVSPYAMQVAPHVKFRPLAAYQEVLSELGFRLVEIRPLYKWLNRTYPFISSRQWMMDVLAPVFCRLDNRLRTPVKGAISLGVWEKI